VLRAHTGRSVDLASGEVVIRPLATHVEMRMALAAR
jgi:hypothetical protein